MNSIKINSVTPKPQNGPAGKPPAKNDRLKSDGKKPKKTNDKPIKAQKNQKTELAHAQKETGKGKELAKSIGSETPKIDEYLKMISRLENKVKNEEMAEDDLKKVIKSLEEKILSLDDQQKLKLKNLKFFKKQGIDNVKTLKKTLDDMFHDVFEQKTLFEFLKSQEFITVLLKGDDKANTYSPQKMPKPPLTGFKIETPDQHPSKVTTKTSGNMKV